MGIANRGSRNLTGYQQLQGICGDSVLPIPMCQTRKPLAQGILKYRVMVIYDSRLLTPVQGELATTERKTAGVLAQRAGERIYY